MFPDLRIAGSGNVPSALTDVRDIGRYFAKLIRDWRTENKYVLVYNELWTQNQIWDALSRISGEDIPKNYTSAAELESTIASASAAVEAGAKDVTDITKLIGAQYRYSWGIRGDNTPEYAKFLGYVTSRELYPDMGFIRFEQFLKELVEDGGHLLYEEKRAQLQEMLKAASKANQVINVVR